MAEMQRQSRYLRVQEILNTAAAKGKIPFWPLPLAELLTVELDGVRIIAPATTADSHTCCCHGSAPSPAADATAVQATVCASRSAASGLIQGLRGAAPFDGSRFPRLPWGGKAVAAADIQFIADWIDDNCPAADHVLGEYLLPGRITIQLDESRTTGEESGVQKVFATYSETPNTYKYQHGELKQRMNIDCMNAAQLQKLRAAFRALYDLNDYPEDSRSYNSLAQIHQNHCQHGWERFLPWHRIYLYEFEQALQDHFPDVTMPYWDWTMPHYYPSRPAKGLRIPRALQAFLTEESLSKLKSFSTEQVKKLKELLGVHYYSQHTFFAKVAALLGKEATVGACRAQLIDALLAANALWYPLRYPGEYHNASGETQTINTAIHYHYPTNDDIDQLLSLRTFRDFGGGSLYNDSFGFLDQNPHNTMHIWTGGMNPTPASQKNGAAKATARAAHFNRNLTVRVAGRDFHKKSDLYSQPDFGDMFSNLTASYDPIFWPVHANVDRLWGEWQQLHPQAVPADLDAVLTPWSYTTADTLDMARFGYEYVKSSYILPIGLGAPVGRFDVQPLDIPEAVRTAFQVAEVRLHRVPQLTRSCFIRVFLNLPGANASTALDDPHYAGYLAIFGHGACYGGPGHCDLPPARARPYDRRPRSHNTPRNHRINVTKCAKALLEAGATTLQITLVVIGADYQEENELLRLEGVSLNFLD